MKPLFFSFILLLGTSFQLTAQEVRFPINDPHATSKAELRQTHLEGVEDAVLTGAPQLTEIGCDFYPDFHSMGYYYLENLEMEKAEHAFITFLALAAQEPIAYYSMGDYYLATQNYAKALQYYEQAAGMGMARAHEKAEAVRKEGLLNEVESQKSGWK